LRLSLLKLGQPTQTEQIFETILDQTADHPTIISIRHIRIWTNIHKHEKVLTIRQNLLPPHHLDWVFFYDNIGEVYHSMKKYYKTVSFYEKFLAIKQQHRSNVLQSVRIYESPCILWKSTRHFSETHPSNFTDLVTCCGNIDLVHENIDDYLKAHAVYERAVNINEKISIEWKENGDLYLFFLEEK
jgi:tetratricopeptide (TPR) repeat protein